MKYKIKKNKKKDTYSQHCNKYKEFQFFIFHIRINDKNINA